MQNIIHKSIQPKSTLNVIQSRQIHPRSPSLHASIQSLSPQLPQGLLDQIEPKFENQEFGSPSLVEIGELDLNAPDVGVKFEQGSTDHKKGFL